MVLQETRNCRNCTYGSELVEARTFVEKVIDLRLPLCYLVVPIQAKSYVLRDNKTGVESGTRPQSKLHKQHTALFFHQVREAIAAKIYHISVEINPAEILSKHWGCTQVWTMLQPLLF